MPTVQLTGRIRDVTTLVVNPELRPRLYFRPNQAWIGDASRGFVDYEGEATWTDLNEGAFEVSLYSEPNDPRLWYTMCFDNLPPGQNTEPPENRSRSYVEWPFKIFPGEGGDITDVINQQIGLALVYAAPDAYRYDVWNQLHWNTSTGWVYERKWTP